MRGQAEDATAQIASKGFQAGKSGDMPSAPPPPVARQTSSTPATTATRGADPGKSFICANFLPYLHMRLSIRDLTIWYDPEADTTVDRDYEKAFVKPCFETVGEIDFDLLGPHRVVERHLAVTHRSKIPCTCETP